MLYPKMILMALKQYQVNHTSKSVLHLSKTLWNFQILAEILGCKVEILRYKVRIRSKQLGFNLELATQLWICGKGKQRNLIEF